VTLHFSSFLQSNMSLNAIPLSIRNPFIACLFAPRTLITINKRCNNNTTKRPLNMMCNST
jgi:hypothetical protein